MSLIANTPFKPPGWNLASASYSGKFKLVSGQSTAPRSAFFSTDGSIMYMQGLGDERYIYQYDVGTNFDVSTATYANKFFDLGNQQVSVQDVFIKPDGSKMYTVGSSNDSSIQYPLSAPWQVDSTGTKELVFSFNSPVQTENNPDAIHFTSDGNSMYVVGSGNRTVFQYTLDTPWIITPNTLTGNSFDVFSETGNSPAGLVLTPNGTRMFVISASNRTVFQYDLSIPYNVSSAVYNGVFLNVSSEAASSQNISFNSSGTLMYVIDDTTNTIYQYNL